MNANRILIAFHLANNDLDALMGNQAACELVGDLVGAAAFKQAVRTLLGLN